jgi:hypothetical protein
MQLNDKDAITGTLLTFERRKCPQYSALSYVCGQGTCDQEVYVNGGRLRVKPNLMAALKQFKSCMTYVLQDDGNPSKPLEDRICWVWVDAMSINQADATEKAEQIGGMHHIYREASKVDICLGYFGSDLGCVALILRWVEGVRHPAESGRRRWTQFELVEQLRNFGVSPSNLRAIFDNMQIDLESHLERESLKKSIGFKNCNRAPTRFSKDEVLGFEESSVAPRSMQRNPTFFEKMFDILEHEWFSRLWTYQEYHLAVMCEGGATLEYLLGDHAIYWDTLTNLWLAMISPVDPLGTYLCISKKRIERTGSSRVSRRWTRPSESERRCEPLDTTGNFLPAQSSRSRRPRLCDSRTHGTRDAKPHPYRLLAIRCLDLHECFRACDQPRRWRSKATPLLGPSRSHSIDHPRAPFLVSRPGKRI